MKTKGSKSDPPIDNGDGTFRFSDRTIRKMRDLGFRCFDLTPEEERRIFGKRGQL